MISRAEARTTYMVLVSHYVALSDERKEGLVRLTVQEETGGLIPDFEAHFPEFQITFYETGKIPPHFPVHLNKAVSLGLRKDQEVTEAELVEFLKSMKRRLLRDIKKYRGIFSGSGKGNEGRLNNRQQGSSCRRKNSQDKGPASGVQ
jgi:hypothetical protein